MRRSRHQPRQGAGLGRASPTRAPARSSQLQPDARQGDASTTTSRRSSCFTRTPRSIDPDFAAKVREALRDPDVAIIGCAGAIGVRSIAWWEGAVTWASFTHRYKEFGGGQFDSYSYVPETTPSFAETGEVDSIDGFVIVLSAWAVRNLRFDESLGRLHGYDFDICCQAREAGKKVVTIDSQMVHHHSLDLIADADSWIEAYIRLADKWNDRLIHRDGPGSDWRARALRSEAECAAAQGLAITHQLKLEAFNKLYFKFVNSSSWRLTSPLRKAKAMFTRTPVDSDQVSVRPKSPGASGRGAHRAEQLFEALEHRRAAASPHRASREAMAKTSEFLSSRRNPPGGSLGPPACADRCGRRAGRRGGASGFPRGGR